MPTLNTVLKSVPTDATVVGNSEKQEKVEVRQTVRDWTKMEGNTEVAEEIITRLEEAGRDTEHIAQVLAVVALYETGASWATSAQATGLTQNIKPKAGADSARSRYLEAFAIEAEKTSEATAYGKERRALLKPEEDTEEETASDSGDTEGDEE